MMKILLLLPVVLAVLATTAVVANARPMHRHHRMMHHRMMMRHHMMHHRMMHR